MPHRLPILRSVLIAAVAVLAVVSLTLTYQSLRARVAADVYRQRLDALATEYDHLQDLYNEAIRRTAVTELLVRDGTLSVRVRNALGLIREVETPFDPTREIYVDYVVLDGRLWIRRVFDSRTPPGEALVIEPQVADIDWNAENAAHGKAVYRLLDEGRWIVSVTGNGALGLTRAPDDAPVHLSSPPAIRDFDEVTADADAAARAIGFGDIWSHLRGLD